ncbi:MAG: 30S ribosomal protein S9 [Bacilli bacterium]|nr:30S ribosomal protein S9 [Clostridium sp.]MDY6015737.1 30S ribosomal protein S9 [Bacilli bacterium]CCZ60539.1 30S ribosomal protein S9 [Clostridium sp. CAG:710]
MAKAKQNVYYGTGKRKTSIAKVKLIPGKGNITVNGKDVHEYLPFETLVMDLTQPLEMTNTKEIFDVVVEVKGGGFSGQTGAIRLGITKALLDYDSTTPADSENSYRKTLKAAGFITRDSRIKERKKPGLKKARRAPQFSKR